MAETKSPTKKPIKAPSKDSLLEDLESIKDSLLEEDLEDDIPILTDAVLAKPKTREEEQLAFDEQLIFDEEDEETVFDDLVDEDADGDDEALLRAAYRQTLEEPIPTLEGQQSLFEDFNATGIRQAIDDEELPAASGLPSAKGENPFLPKHIRDRLHQGKSSFLEEITLVSASLSKVRKEASESDSDKYEQKPEIKVPKQTQPASEAQLKLVDELVAEYLPKIEKDLRARLIKILDEKNTH